MTDPGKCVAKFSIEQAACIDTACCSLATLLPFYCQSHHYVEPALFSGVLLEKGTSTWGVQGKPRASFALVCQASELNGKKWVS